MKKLVIAALLTLAPVAQAADFSYHEATILGSSPVPGGGLLVNVFAPGEASIRTLYAAPGDPACWKVINLTLPGDLASFAGEIPRADEDIATLGALEASSVVVGNLATGSWSSTSCVSDVTGDLVTMADGTSFSCRYEAGPVARTCKALGVGDCLTVAGMNSAGDADVPYRWPTLFGCEFREPTSSATSAPEEVVELDDGRG